ncbi:MAG TPA: MerR family transcriptional regulator [Desulfobacterales bacterium]|nr:MerR family transcriptional regulator [Desulfobacterales bacterium]HIP37926.1 MerR family transcriptional regulator [Desulfocapsa sulfexigens]
MKKDLQPTIFDQDSEYTLRELCHVCKVHAQFIQDLIDEGIISPHGESPQEWRFEAVEVKRIQISIRLQEDLRINLPGTALALDLLEEIEELRRVKSRLEQLYALEKRI